MLHLTLLCEFRFLFLFRSLSFYIFALFFLFSLILSHSLIWPSPDLSSTLPPNLPLPELFQHSPANLLSPHFLSHISPTHAPMFLLLIHNFCIFQFFIFSSNCAFPSTDQSLLPALFIFIYVLNVFSFFLFPLIVTIIRKWSESIWSTTSNLTILFLISPSSIT